MSLKNNHRVNQAKIIPKVIPRARFAELETTATADYAEFAIECSYSISSLRSAIHRNQHEWWHYPS